MAYGRKAERFSRHRRSCRASGPEKRSSRLLPEAISNQAWATEIAAMKPSICHFEIYLGFEGDIAKHGATRSNHWFLRDLGYQQNHVAGCGQPDADDVRLLSVAER